MFAPFPVVIIAILLGLYQIRLKPLLEVGGVWREIQDVGTELKNTCTHVEELKGCERKRIFRLLGFEGLSLTLLWYSPLEIRLHEPSGVLFLACAPPASRSPWLPFMGTYNTSAAGAGYVATYDLSSKRVTKLTAKGFDHPYGLTPLGMDVVPSTRNPDDLSIYIINMRPPFVDLDMDLPPGVREAKRDEVASARAKGEGPDPSVEVFRYVLGGDSMQHVATWTDENVMISPNDVVGLPDGKGAWFTNSLPYRAGLVRSTTPNYRWPTTDFCSW